MAGVYTFNFLDQLNGSTSTLVTNYTTNPPQQTTTVTPDQEYLSGPFQVDYTAGTASISGLTGSLQQNGNNYQASFYRYGIPFDGYPSIVEVFNYQGMAPLSFDSVTFSSFSGNGGVNSISSNDSAMNAPVVVTFNPVVCFCSGTNIKTREGNVAVEHLSVGEVIFVSSGEHRSIRWLGHRTIDCAHHPRPHEVMPIRISAHAFANNRPSRDLRLSPGHAICVDAVGEVLIPAAALVNGTTIVQEHVDTVTYWHVELEGDHDIILAENLPCESYIEMGNRSFFVEAEATALYASPDPDTVTHADFCRPFHQDGLVVVFVRERLAARSPELGWALKEEPFADLHLMVDGQRVEAETRGLSARFLVPAAAKEVWLLSNTAVPAEIGMAPDLRSLGVCIGSIVIDNGFEPPRTILANHPLLRVGFHNIEEGPQRWTAGRSRMSADLWEGCRSSFFLRVELTRPALPRLVKPSAAREDLKKLTV